MSTVKFQTLAVLIYAAFIACGCGSGLPTEVSSLQQELKAARSELEVLKREINETRQENQSLRERLAAVNAKTDGGLALSEREKQMDAREARLTQLEKDIKSREERIEQDERFIEEEKQRLALDKDEFISSREEKFVKIGEAQQIDRRYEELRTDKENAVEDAKAANARANNLLKIIVACTVILVCALVFGIVIYQKRRVELKRIDSVMEVLRSDRLSPEITDQIAARLGRTLPQGKGLLLTHDEE